MDWQESLLAYAKHHGFNARPVVGGVEIEIEFAGGSLWERATTWNELREKMGF